MITPTRVRKGALIGAVAAVAAIGATSPVWAGTGSSSAPAAGHTSADSATITALQAKIAALRSTLRADEIALQKATRADIKADRAAPPGMIADRMIRISARGHRGNHRFERLTAIAPGAMHVKVTANIGHIHNAW